MIVVAWCSRPCWSPPDEGRADSFCSSVMSWSGSPFRVDRFLASWRGTKCQLNRSCRRSQKSLLPVCSADRVSEKSVGRVGHPGAAWLGRLPDVSDPGEIPTSVKASSMRESFIVLGPHG